ncbi:MAG: alpha/beta family hydrolase [Terracidiphilus sp.]|jgi:alpha/beta superfamily hydrolase
MFATAAPDPTGTTTTSGANAPARVRSVDLNGPAGRLEAVLNEGAPYAPLAALVCHPHPKGGGTMHNKVVYHAMKVLNDPSWGLALPVLRFNFRGTGLSQGIHDGKAESEDVLAAMHWLENEYKLPLVVAGFSFGSAMALRACCRCGEEENEQQKKIRALVALGLPTHAEGRDYKYKFLAECKIPKLFLSGDQDKFAPAAQLAQVAATAAEPKQLTMISGADHFFAGQLAPMQQALSVWLKEQMR